MTEKELRALFQAAGYERAPDALHGAVMERSLAQVPATVVQPVITPRQWAKVMGILATLSALAWLASGYSHKAPSTVSILPLQEELAHAGRLLHNASWVTLSMGVAFVLTVLDQLLDRMHQSAAS